jgi:nucleoside-diphosphate-sugar epimerase
MASALVVGSAGALGRLLCERLTAKGLDRRHPGASFVSGVDAEIERGSVVINVAGPRIRPHLGWSEYMREHVALSSLVARSMRSGTHLIHVSSAAVYGSRTDTIGVDTPEAPELFPSPSYAWAKLAGELAARAIAAERGVRITVVRFPVVYGPGVESGVDSLMRYARRGLRLELAPRGMRQHMLHSGLLVHAFKRIIEDGVVLPRPLVLADPFVLTNADLNEAIAGRGWRAARVPIRLDRAAMLVRRWPGFPQLDAPVKLASLGVFGVDTAFDHRPAFEALGLDVEEFTRDRTFDAFVQGWA